MRYKVMWTNTSADSEWIYFGNGEEVNENIIIKTIISHFTDDSLFLVSTRQNSFETNKKDTATIIEEILKLQDLLLWDMNFKRVIEFNHIGVMRSGEVRSQ